MKKLADATLVTYERLYRGSVGKLDNKAYCDFIDSQRAVRDNVKNKGVKE